MFRDRSTPIDDVETDTPTRDSLEESHVVRGGLLVVPFHRKRIFALNETGRLLYERISQGMDPAELAAEFAEGFGLSYQNAFQDIENSLREWRRVGLLSSLPDNDPAEVKSLRPLPRCSESEMNGFPVRRFYSFQGRTVCVRYRDSSIDKRLHPRLSCLESPDDGFLGHVDLWAEGDEYFLRSVKGELEQSSSSDEVVGLLMRELATTFHPGCQWIAQLHASAIVKGSTCVVIPGHKGSGKTTLCMGLVAAGFEYLCDDHVSIDHNGQLRAFPLCPAIKPGSLEVLERKFPSIRQSPGCTVGGQKVRYLDPRPYFPSQQEQGLEIGALIFPKYRQEAVTSGERLEPMVIIQRILQTNGWLSLDSAHVHRWIDLAETVPAYSIVYSSLQEAVEFVMGLDRK